MQEDKQKRPKAGIGIIVLNKDNKILLSKRSDCKLYGVPGGLLEKYESWEQAASRELKEETNIEVASDNIVAVQVFNALEMSESYHNVAIIMTAAFPEGQTVKNNEPHKHGEWEWWSFDEVKKRIDELFWPNKQMIVDYPKLADSEYLRNKIANPPKNKSCFFPDD